MDEYIEPYADDLKIMELRAKEAIIDECRTASSNPDDTDAINTVLANHANAADLFSVPELIEFIHSWRTPCGDVIGRHAVDCALLNLEISIQDRIGEIGFEELYRPFINASPAKVDGITRLAFLSALFPGGRSVLMLNSSKIKEGLPWNVGLGEDIGGEWFWPLPVRVEGDPEHYIEKKKESVAFWTAATASFSGDEIDLMTDQIITSEIPVRVVMSTASGTSVVFRIEASDEVEWRAACRKLRNELKALGMSCPPFRYDWVAPMIHSPFTRLVYFSP